MNPTSWSALPTSISVLRSFLTCCVSFFYACVLTWDLPAGWVHESKLALFLEACYAHSKQQLPHPKIFVIRPVVPTVLSTAGCGVGQNGETVVGTVRPYLGADSSCCTHPLLRFGGFVLLILGSYCIKNRC
jgi:hypothetical protein